MNNLLTTPCDAGCGRRLAEPMDLDRSQYCDICAARIQGRRRGIKSITTIDGIKTYQLNDGRWVAIYRQDLDDMVLTGATPIKAVRAARLQHHLLNEHLPPLTVAQAFRAYNRAMAPLYQEHSHALDMAAAYDCGEWSGQSVDEHYDEEFSNAEARILNRFGYDGHDMFNEEQRCNDIAMNFGVSP